VTKIKQDFRITKELFDLLNALIGLFKESVELCLSNPPTARQWTHCGMM